MRVKVIERTVNYKYCMRECAVHCSNNADFVGRMDFDIEFILIMSYERHTRKLILFSCTGYFVINYYPNQFFCILSHKNLYGNGQFVFLKHQNAQIACRRFSWVCVWVILSVSDRIQAIEKNRRKKGKDGQLSKDLRTNHVQAYWLLHRLKCLLARALYTKSFMEFM